MSFKMLLGKGKSTMDDRSPHAKAMSKVSEILALCLLMVIPALIGSWLDKRFSTVLLFTLLGLGVGMAGAVMQLFKLVSPQPDEPKLLDVDRVEQEDQVDERSC